MPVDQNLVGKPNNVGTLYNTSVDQYLARNPNITSKLIKARQYNTDISSVNKIV